MRRIAAILLLLLLALPASAANFYWKTSKTDLDNIGAKADGDRGLVISSAGAMTFYYHTGGVWVESGLTMTKTITGALPVLTDVTSPTAAQAYGSYDVMTGAGTVALPAAAVGMSICIYTSAAATIQIDPNGSDTITLAGTLLTGGYRINNSSAAAGDYMCLVSQAANKWMTLGGRGTWASSGS